MKKKKKIKRREEIERRGIIISKNKLKGKKTRIRKQEETLK